VDGVEVAKNRMDFDHGWRGFNGWETGVKNKEFGTQEIRNGKRGMEFESKRT
jgi:hypothetical protein